MFPSASHTITFSPATSQNRSAISTATTNLNLAPTASENVAWPVAASSIFSLTGTDGTVGWHYGTGTSGINLSEMASKNLAGGVSANTTISFAPTASGTKVAYPTASNAFQFADTASEHGDFHLASVNSVNFVDAASEHRGVEASATSGFSFSYQSSGDGATRKGAVMGFNLDSIATAVKVALCSASSAILVTPSVHSNRGTSSTANSTLYLAPVSVGHKQVYLAAASSFSLIGLTSETRRVHSLATSSFAVAGTLGAAQQDKHPSASSKLMFIGTASAIDVITVSASSVFNVKAQINDIRIIQANAVTSIKFRTDPRPLFGPIGGNLMAAQYVGYLGQVQQGQTVTLMLRSIGYGGQIMTPDGPPSVTIYDDAGSSQTFTLPALDRANSVFSLPVFLGLTFPLGL